MSMLQPWRRRHKTAAERPDASLPPKATAQRALLKRLLEEFIPGPQRLALSPMLSMAFDDWTLEKGEYAAKLIRGIAEQFDAIDREHGV